MNNERRQEITKVISSLEELAKTVEAMQNIAENLTEDIENIRTAEEDCFENIPEGLQGGDKGEAAQAAIEALGQSLELPEAVATLMEAINDTISSLEEAKG